MNRTFLQDHSIQDLFTWVEAAEYVEPNPTFKVPKKFSLNTSFPTKTLDPESTESLKEAGLVPNAMVLLHDMDEDE